MALKTRLLFIFLIFISSIGNLDANIIIHDKEKLQSLKRITIRSVTADSLTFDPHLLRTVKSILTFELLKAGFELTGPEEVPVATLDLKLTHARYFRGATEKDNLSLDVSLIDSEGKKICSLFLSETRNKNLLDPVELQKRIRTTIHKLGKR